MASAIRLRVLTDEGLVLEEDAVSVIAPGEGGYVGFLRHHAPLVTTLASGMLTYRTPSGQTKAVRVGGGLLEISKNRLTILTTSVSDAPAST